MTRYGRSPWIDGFPRLGVPAYGPAPRSPHDRRRHRRRRIDRLCDGLCLCGRRREGGAARSRSASGGAAAARRSAGLATPQGRAFSGWSRPSGCDAARRAWQAWRRGALDFATLLRRLSVRCELEAKSTLRIARTVEQSAQLKREHKARRDAGVDAVARQRTRGTDRDGHRRGLRPCVPVTARPSTLFVRRSALRPRPSIVGR